MASKTDQPGDILIEAGDRAIKHVARRAMDFGQAWLPGHLKVLAGLLAILGVGAGIYLPVVFALGLIALTAVSFIYAVIATRQMNDARRVERYMRIPFLREQQQRLKAEEALDTVARVLAGDHEARRELHSIRRPEILQGLALIQHERATAERAGRPTPRGTEKRGPARPKRPDVAAIGLRQEERRAERRAIEAEIQALADPSDPKAARVADETREQVAAKRTAAREAERVARNRRRRGLPATPNQDARELRMSLAIGPEGVRDVRRLGPEPTPEEVAARGGVTPAGLPPQKTEHLETAT